MRRYRIGSPWATTRTVSSGRARTIRKPRAYRRAASARLSPPPGGTSRGERSRAQARHVPSGQREVGRLPCALELGHDAEIDRRVAERVAEPPSLFLAVGRERTRDRGIAVHRAAQRELALRVAREDHVPHGQVTLTRPTGDCPRCGDSPPPGEQSEISQPSQIVGTG